MKKVALIGSYCDTHEKIEVLNKNINIVKNLGVDVIVISPIFLPETTTSLCDYYFQTKDNLLLEWPTRAMLIWKQIFIEGSKYRMSKTFGDYGWAGLHQVKQLSDLALSLEYDQFFHMIYDLKIDGNVIEGFKSNKTCSIFPSTRNGQIWKAGLHFMIFDKKNLSRFISNIHLDSYLNLRDSDVFAWLENLHSIFPYNFEEIPVEDEIYYYEGHDFFNYSPIEEQPFFVIKNYETLETIKLLFYSVEEENFIKIKVEEKNIEEKISNYKIIDLGFNKMNPKSVLILYKDREYDITSTIDKIKHNTFRPE